MTLEELEVLSDEDNYEASHIIGRRYHEGIGVDIDLEEAVYYYEMGQENNYSKSLTNLGNMYRGGEYFPANIIKAIKLYCQAIENGSINSLYNLAQVFLYEENVLDLEEGIRLLNEAISKGSEASVLELADCYLTGYGVKKDYFKAIEIYQTIPKNEVALNNLGNIFYNEEGMAQDLEKSFDFYKKSADLGYVHGQKNTAECYEFGEGVEKNNKLALKYYKLAAEQDCDYSARKVKKLTEEGDL